jgi:hypothetical protein
MMLSALPGYVLTYLHLVRSQLQAKKQRGIFFFFKETSTGALYYSNLVIYTNKPFASNLICLLTPWCRVLPEQLTGDRKSVV